MKRVLSVVVVLATVVAANAQVFSVQSMDDLRDFEPGLQDVRGSIGITDDIYYIGARYNHTFSESVRAFGGVGYASNSDDSDDSATVIHGGGIWLFTDTLVQTERDLSAGVRAELVVPIHDDLTGYYIVLGVHGGLDMSADKKWRLYGGAGLYFLDYEYEYTHTTTTYNYDFSGGRIWADREYETRKYDDTETGIYATAGTSYEYSERVKLFGELTYVDTKDFDQDITVGVGGAVTL